MKLDVSHFKKVSSDGTSTTLQHPKGHEIRIAHNALSSDMKKKLAKLPEVQKFKSGGMAEVADNMIGAQDTETPPVAPPIQLQENASGALNIPSEEQIAQAGQKFMPAPVPEAPPVAPAIPDQPAAPLPSSGPPDIFGTQALAASQKSSKGALQAGAIQEQKALSEQGDSEALALQERENKIQEIDNHYQTAIADTQKEWNAAMEDYKNGHINPTEYMENMSVPGRVATAISLIAGGIGAGITGGPNVALDYLNKQIDRNIQAQQADLGKKHTMLSAYMEKYGNLKDATNMARATQLGFLEIEMKKAAAEAKDPLAKARLLQGLGAIEQQYGPLQQQTSMNQALLKGTQSGQKVAPEQVIRVLVPKEKQAQADKDLAEKQKLQKVNDNMLSAFDQLAELNTLKNRALSPYQTKAKIEEIKASVIPSLSKETAGKYTEQDAKTIEHLFDTAWKDKNTMAIARGRLMRMAKERDNFPLLDTYFKPLGIDAASGQYNPQGEKKIKLGPPVK